MTILGMPLEMFLIFAATIAAGSIGALHYLLVYVVLRRPVPGEAELRAERVAAAGTASPETIAMDDTVLPG